MISRRLRSLIKKEFTQFFRDRTLVGLVIYIFLEVALCGWALHIEVKDLPMAVVDLNKTPASRELISDFTSSGHFKPEVYSTDINGLEELLDSGRVSVALVIPRTFSKEMVNGQGASVQFLADGSNSNTATLAVSYASQIVQDFSAEVLVQTAGISSEQMENLPVISNSIEALYDPGLEFTHFMMIAMVAIAALMTGVLLAAGTIVREKEAGTLEQLMVTPITPADFILAKILPMGIVKMVGLGVGVTISAFLFDVPVKGSLMLFFALSTLIFFAGMGIGALIASYSKNLQQALLLCFFGLFPILFLSGTVVPLTSMPEPLQYLSLLSPLRYFMTISLGIFLKGVGLKVLWPQAAALAAYGMAVFLLSIRRLRKGLM